MKLKFTQHKACTFFYGVYVLRSQKDRKTENTTMRVGPTDARCQHARYSLLEVIQSNPH